MSWFTKKTPVTVTQEKGVQVEIEQIGWISVKDKVPEFCCRVLVSSDFGVLTGHRVKETEKGHEWELGIRSSNPYMMHYSPEHTYNVTHWMPLPPSAT